jgi:hypothetical protein
MSGSAKVDRTAVVTVTECNGSVTECNGSAHHIVMVLKFSRTALRGCFVCRDLVGSYNIYRKQELSTHSHRIGALPVQVNV